MSNLVAGVIAGLDGCQLAKTVSSLANHVSTVLVSIPPWSGEDVLDKGVSSLEAFEGGRVIIVPWQGDFASTRNFQSASRHASNDSWMLCLSAGDSVAAQDLRLLSRTIDNLPKQGFLALEAEARVYHSHEEDRPPSCPGQVSCSGGYPGFEAGSSSYTPSRVLCAHSCSNAVVWEGAVHEQLKVDQKAVKRVQWLVVHRGTGSCGVPSDHYEKLLDERVLSCPDDPCSWYHLGSFQLASGRALEAVSSLHKSLAIGKFPASSLAIARAMMTLCEYQQAEPHLSEYLRSYPEDSGAWMALLVCSFKRDNFDGMDYYLGRALKTRTRHKYDLARFALYAARKMSYETKVALYEKIVKSLPDA